MYFDRGKMKCLLVFDNLNDIIYMKCNKSFSKHVINLAEMQGFTDKGIDETTDENLNPNIVMQLFSPLVTSQRIMINHFSNAYSNITCYNDLNMIFEEYVGYLFVCIGYGRKYWLKRFLGVFISIIKHVCGPDVSALKSCQRNSRLVSYLLDSWYHVVSTEQSMLVEAVEQLRVNTQVASTCLKTLTEATDRLKSTISNSQMHALIMANRRFVSLYSTRNASELLAGDILLLSLLSEVTEQRAFDNESGTSFITVQSDSSESESDSENESFYSPDGSKASDNMSVKSCITLTSENEASSVLPVFDSCLDFVLLLGKHKPHAVHVSYIAPGVPVFFIYEVGNELLNTCLLETLQSLFALQELQTRGTTDREVIHSSLEVADNAMKKLNDSFRKKSVSSTINKTHSSTIKTIAKKWEPIKKKYQDYLKSHNTELLQRIDSTIENIISSLRNIYTNCVMDDSLASSNRDAVLLILQSVRKSLQDVGESFRTKITRNFTLGTKSTISINRYLEEFPGLVHFLYIDRSTHRFVAPSLDFSSQETTLLTKKKIWSMVEFARSHLQEGRTALMWKDTIFNYSYFLWFEDTSGTPLKPKTSATTVIKSCLTTAGVLTNDFYRQFTKKCFPTQPVHRIRCYELFSVHLGLVTSSCVLEQARRLTATIWEVTGVPAIPLELF